MSVDKTGAVIYGSGMMKKCPLCEKVIEAERAKIGRRSHKRWISGGLLWLYGICPECNAKEKLAIKRLIGWTPEVSFNRLRAVFSEKLIAKYFKRRGFSVICEHKPGPDLIITKDGITKKVEVKNLLRCNYNSFNAPAIYRARRNDDILAVVFPDMSFKIMPMSEYTAREVKVFRKIIKYD